MDTGVLIGIVVLLVIVVLVAALLGRKRRTTHLQERFGGEYDRTVQERGDRGDAEAELTARERRHRKLDIKPLDPDTRDRYQAAWDQTQTRFVDAPEEAVREADSLVARVMRDRGYPVDDFEQRSADVSVDHPDVVENYRVAHGISMANDNGAASTEDLREGMVHYRALFERLLDGSARTDERAREG